MNEYLITYETGNNTKECIVFATSITKALGLVDVANRNNTFYGDIIDCQFIRHIDELYIEKVN